MEIYAGTFEKKTHVVTKIRPYWRGFFVSVFNTSRYKQVHLNQIINKFIHSFLQLWIIMRRNLNYLAYLQYIHFGLDMSVCYLNRC